MAIAAFHDVNDLEAESTVSLFARQGGGVLDNKHRPIGLSCLLSFLSSSLLMQHSCTTGVGAETIWDLIVNLHPGVYGTGGLGSSVDGGPNMGEGGSKQVITEEDCNSLDLLICYDRDQRLDGGDDGWG